MVDESVPVPEGEAPREPEPAEDEEVESVLFNDEGWGVVGEEEDPKKFWLRV